MTNILRFLNLMQINVLVIYTDNMASSDNEVQEHKSTLNLQTDSPVSRNSLKCYMLFT